MSSAAINPLGSGDAGLGSLAERWQQVAAAVARPAEGAGQPGEATAHAGTADGPTGASPATDAANRLPPTNPGATTGAAPRASMLDSLPPAQASAAMSGAATQAAGAQAATLAASQGATPATSATAQLAPAAALPAAVNAAAIRPTGSPASAAEPMSNPAQAAPTAAALAQPAASTGATPRTPADTLQVPVMVSPLFTTAPAPLRRPPPHAAQRRPVQPVQPRGEEGQDAPPDDDPEDTDAADLAALADTGASAQEADAPVPGTAPAQPGLPAWRAQLQQAGQQALLRELDLRRHILLVCPQPALPGDLRDRAVAWLLGGPQGTALALPARFVAPARLGLPAQWRLHRTEGGAQDGLRSRPPLGDPTGGTAPAIGCRITFGDLPLLPDPLHAHLSLAQPRRFLRALAGQWSLLLLVWPDGAAA